MRKVFFLQRDLLELTGVIHNHTNYSYDCDVPVKSVIEAGYKNRLDYITLNDHEAIPDAEDIAKALAYFSEKKKYRPLIIPGSELNDRENSHHLLVFKGTVPEETMTAEETVKLQQRQNAVMFAAHPYEKRVSKRFPLYIWKNLELMKEIHGLEIWNYSSSWLSGLNPKLNGLFLVLFPDLQVKKPFAENLEIWDRINKNGHKFSAIGSTDAHGTKHKVLFFNIRILPHNRLFKTIRTNVLIDEKKKPDQNSVLEALAQGNSYIVNYRLGHPYNFYAGIAKDKETGAVFGEEIPFREGLKFYFRLPSEAKTELFIDGKMAAVKDSKNGFFPVEKPGNYRLAVTRYGQGWIYTNNIYVT